MLINYFTKEKNYQLKLWYVVLENMSEDNSSKGRSILQRDLFVRSIPSDVTSDDLATFFSEFVPVKHAVVVTNPGTGESKGFGFVSFVEAKDAQDAMDKAMKAKLNGARLRIEFAKPRERKDGSKESNESPEVEKRRPRLIIRNMPWSVRDKNVLVKIFSKYGKVVDAIIPRTNNNRMSGFAFVTMRKKVHALKAIEDSKDLRIEGREVAVDFALEKGKWESKNGDDVESEEFDDESSGEEEEGDDDESESEIEDNEEVDGFIEDEAGVSGGGSEDNEGEGEDEEAEEDEVEEDEPSRPKRRPAPNDCTIFVRNIPYDATDDLLQEHFSQFGRVRYAMTVRDTKLDQPKGTAFVAFVNSEDCESCVTQAPKNSGSSILVADDVDARYVFEGRILSVAKAVDRSTAEQLSTVSASKRAQLLGKEPQLKDKRNIFLLNEGRVTSESKLGKLMNTVELDIRQKSYDLRKKQLSTNPSLHVSLTRLAIRNIPRAMTEKALKALARTAIVEFAKEVKDGKRQPLTKEEVLRSKKADNSFDVKSKHGIVRQAKVVKEHKVSGDLGRSRGYGFVEYRDHRTALMGLRWLNAHYVTKEELISGLTKEEAETIEHEGAKGRTLVVEFAIENAQVVKRRRENQFRAKTFNNKRKFEEVEDQKEEPNEAQNSKKSKEAEFDPVKKIIANKRKAKKVNKR